MMTPKLRSLMLRLVVGCVTACAAGVVGCSSEDASLGGDGRGACEGLNWRSPTPGTVVCPGTSECACGSGSVCCVDNVGGTAANPRCVALTECPSSALTCDGAEDCPSGQVCCAFGNDVVGGSECRDPQDCFFSGQEAVMCRSEGECDGLKSCTPATPGSYLAGLAAVCAL